jgi:hypothetical protein
VDDVVRADTGLGTAYERWALNRLLGRFHSRYQFHNLLEAPGDGMTGISGLNSLVLGLKGVEVSLLLPGERKKSPLPGRSGITMPPRHLFIPMSIGMG